MVLPHLASPFRVVNGAVAVLEQDSIDEIAQCVEVLVSTLVGQRIEVPTYGIPNPVFGQEDGRTSPAIAAAIKKWESRASAAVTDAANDVDELVRNIKINLGATDVG